MLKLYTNKSFLTEENRSLVFPLLFDLYYLKSEILIKYFNLVETVSGADIVVFPVDYIRFLESKENFNTLLKEAKENDKPIWIYSSGDYGFTNYIENSYTFRLGGFHSRLSSSTFILPSFIDDPFEIKFKKGFNVLPKKEKPSIGFVGHAKSGVFKYLKEYVLFFKYSFKRKIGFAKVDKQVFFPSAVKRAIYLNVLHSNKSLKTSFILRKKYRGGIKTTEQLEKTTNEFYNNIFDNLYTFCIRGVGNFSVRLYETLAMGRIPILLNTDCRLPLEEKINWNDHILIIDSNKKDIVNQILEYHNSKNEVEIKNIQNNNRKLWQTHLRRHSYFEKIHNEFIKNTFS